MSDCIYQFGEDINYENILVTDPSYLDDFDCGNKNLNKYMCQCVEDGSSTIHALIDKDLNKIIGVCFLKCSAYIEKQGIANYNDDGELDEDNPFNYIMSPAVEILYFAISVEYQDLQFSSDKSLGCLSNMYLNMMIGDIIDSSDNFAKVKYVLLYSVTDAYRFYTRNNFCAFGDRAITENNERLIDCIPMFLELPND